MTYLPADQARIRGYLDALLEAAREASLANESEACKRALTRVWAINTRAFMAVQEGEDNARAEAWSAKFGEVA